MKTILAHVSAGRALSVEQTLEAFELIMTGQATPAQVGALLGMIAVRGVAREELVGAAKVMRAKATPVTTPAGLRVIDTCGTGGDHAGTFNISTAAALVAARLAPALTGYLIAGHLSPEPGHAIALAALEVPPPLLSLGMRLGEGSGATLAMALCEAACRVVADMATFEAAGVSER